MIDHSIITSGLMINHFKTSGPCRISGDRFFTGGVFECDIARRRSAAVLCIFAV